MSHVVTIKTKFQDLDALRAVLPGLGLEWLEGQTRFRSYTDGISVHAIGVKDHPTAYQIGLVPNKEKAWDILFDPWNGGYGLIDCIGPEARKLRQAYSLEVAKRQALRN